MKVLAPTGDSPRCNQLLVAFSSHVCPLGAKLRNDNAEKIFQVCRQYPWLIVPNSARLYRQHAYYKCYVFVDQSKLPKRIALRDDISSPPLTRFNVPCYSGSCSEVYKEKAFDNTELTAYSGAKTGNNFLVRSSLMFSSAPNN